MGCRVASAGLLRTQEVDCRENLDVCDLSSGSADMRAMPMISRPGRAMTAAARTHSRFSPFACGALLRTQEVGWRGALDVPGLTSCSVGMRAVAMAQYR